MADTVDGQLDTIGRGSEEAIEYRIFGPPGCGKTTHTSRQIRLAVERYGKDAVLVTSFSTAAASELVGRDLPVTRDKVATMHAHCYRALGSPPIAESHASGWNASVGPGWQISTKTSRAIEDLSEEAGNHPGDAVLDRINRWRNQCKDLNVMLYPAEREFYGAWVNWKKNNDLIDFTDMLEIASRDIKVAPGNPRVIFADEAQDFSALQLRIIRQWGKHSDYFLVVGDDDQTIFQFTGATPDAFLKPDIEAKHKITLSQSFRVPRRVHTLAEHWIKGVTFREPKIYKPTELEGETLTTDLTFRNADLIIRCVEKDMVRGKSVMLLTACSYMLHGFIKRLRECGIPFYNPYRAAYAWNPLQRGGRRGVTASDRIRALLVPHGDSEGREWTVKEFKAFASWMRADGTFQHAVKSGLDGLPDDKAIKPELLAEWLLPEAFDGLMSHIMNDPPPELLQWWLDRVLKAHQNAATYPCRVVARYGVERLDVTPQVIVGTIHSVKGGEADVVYLFPDLSAAGASAWDRIGEDRDAVIRQFYVGMTRARERLILCKPAGSYRAVIQ